MFSFLNRQRALVLFSKLVRVSEPSRSPHVRVRVYMYTNPPAADTVQPSFMPHLPIARRRRGLKPIFISRSSILSTRVVSSIVGLCRALPPTPRKRERMIMGSKFSRDLYFIKGRIIITGGSNEEIRVFYDR